MPAPPVGDYQFDPIDRKALYVTRGNELLVNRDSGVSWESLDTHPSRPFSPPVVTPTSPRRILVAAAGELMRSSLDLPLCPERPTALCLDDGRFLVEVAWEDLQGGRGAGVSAPLTADAGTFWFFEPHNVELVVKVLDARAVNGHWWVFFGALTNVDFDLQVRDLATGRSRLYHNPSGRFASRGDTAAFAAEGTAAASAAVPTRPGSSCCPPGAPASPAPASRTAPPSVSSTAFASPSTGRTPPATAAPATPVR
ncbi:MAG TPA: hypothetical protein VHM02_13450 [Thermoanaerobaculia bacterium]|nr:hypothetical protein [Thermoanaerobaculia bacterium]